MVTKVKNSNCEKKNSKTQVVTKIKNSNCVNSKSQIVTAPKKVKLWQNLIYDDSCKNNLTPRQRMRCSLGSILQFSQCFLVSLCLFWYQCYYPHASRDSVIPVCGIFSRTFSWKASLGHGLPDRALNRQEHIWVKPGRRLRGQKSVFFLFSTSAWSPDMILLILGLKMVSIQQMRRGHQFKTFVRSVAVGELG